MSLPIFVHLFVSLRKHINSSRPEIFVSCLPLYAQHLEQLLAHSRC